MFCRSYWLPTFLLTVSGFSTAIMPVVVAQQSSRDRGVDLRRTALKSSTPSDEIVRIDIDGLVLENRVDS